MQPNPLATANRLSTENDASFQKVNKGGMEEMDEATCGKGEKAINPESDGGDGNKNGCIFENVKVESDTEVNRSSSVTSDSNEIVDTRTGMMSS